MLGLLRLKLFCKALRVDTFSSHWKYHADQTRGHWCTRSHLLAVHGSTCNNSKWRRPRASSSVMHGSAHPGISPHQLALASQADCLSKELHLSGQSTSQPAQRRNSMISSFCMSQTVPCVTTHALCSVSHILYLVPHAHYMHGHCSVHLWACPVLYAPEQHYRHHRSCCIQQVPYRYHTGAIQVSYRCHTGVIHGVIRVPIQVPYLFRHN